MDDGVGGRDELIGNFKIHTGDHDSLTIVGNDENNTVYLGGGLGTTTATINGGNGFDSVDFGSTPFRDANTANKGPDHVAADFPYWQKGLRFMMLSFRRMEKLGQLL